MDAHEGRLDERRLSEVLLHLARVRGRGILTVQGEQEIIGLSIFDGQLVSADALNQSLEEGLGRILTGSGLVSNDVLANLSAEHHAGGGRVVDLLLERNYIGRDTLNAALREHAYGLCLQVLQWQQGEYKFYRGDEVAFEEGVEPLPVAELLVRAAEELSSEGLLGGLPPPVDAVYERVDRLDDGLAPETLGELLAPGLAEAEPGEEIQSLLDRVDGSRTIAQLARDTGISEFAARLMVLRMEQADLLRRRREAAVVARKAFAARDSPETEPSAELPSLKRREPVPQGSPVTVPLPVIEPPKVEEPVAAPPPPPPPPPAEPERPVRAPLLETAPPPWLARALAGALVLAVAAYLVVAPWRALLPFPWHADLRQALDGERQTVVFLQVDRAARTFFLLEGRFPESLDELEQRSLLPSSGGLDSRGRRMTYSATATSFSLQAEGAQPHTVGIGGNFLLDPEFQARAATEQPPLVLLD